MFTETTSEVYCKILDVY